ncbi:MAG: acetolactate synthase small subunit [Fimbriimonadaceae bacterium]|nr:acetolactate synthase small subunit [Fimbriimonadaceae bacterium]
MSQTHTITAMVQSEAGTLNRLVSLFRRRGFSLASMSVGDCEQPGFSRATILLDPENNEDDLRLCIAQMIKLIDVVEAEDLPGSQGVMRELALVKIGVGPDRRREVLDVVHIMGGRIAHLSQDAMTVEFTAEPRDIERFLALVEPYEIKEIVRTGAAAMRVEAR